MGNKLLRKKILIRQGQNNSPVLVYQHQNEIKYSKYDSPVWDFEL